MPLAPGSTFAGYAVVRLLGSGGMGEVYLVEHPRLPRHDALKVLPADISSDPEYRERFSREADLAAGLWHPNIVGVRDRGEHEGQLWITMEYVPGINAGDLLQQRYAAGMPIAEVRKIVGAIGRALDYAHDMGLLHRDVKPANIMISEPDGREQRVMLADFGIARTMGEISGLTATNMTVGTVAYAAPEQLMGEHLDGRADQYALAATAYHLLTGSRLFPDTNPAVVIARHLNAPPPLVGSSRPELAAVSHVLATALAKSPEGRYDRCSEFSAEFQASESSADTVQATTSVATSVPRSKQRSLPRKWRALAGVVLVAAILSVIGLLIFQASKNQSTSAQAPTIDTPVAAPVSQPMLASSPTASITTSAVPEHPAATQLAMVVAVNEAGERVNGFQEEPPDSTNTVSYCSTQPSPGITHGVYDCSPNAADAHVCWPASAGTMLCLVNEDPWKKMLRRYTIDIDRQYGPSNPLTTYDSGFEPWPIALTLDDGTRCGRGARRRYPSRDDGYFPAFDCGPAGAVLALAEGQDNGVDRSSPSWTVAVGFVGDACGPLLDRVCSHFPPPKVHTVATAFFPGIER
nr:serine/threonine-protein kinase [Mycolicibacter sinensis]